MVWLLGQRPLSDYLKFVETKVVGGAEMDRRALTDEWRAANDLYYELAETERGIADEAECLELDASAASHVEAVQADPYFQSTFTDLPVMFRMVELDRLVVSQTHVQAGYTADLQQRIGAQPSIETLMRFCLPLEREVPRCEIQRVGSGRFLFLSGSTDFRAHNPVLLKPGQVSGLKSWGPVAGVVGLPVGLGCNYLAVIRDETNRMLLQNGYHRACSLRAMGVTHAPAVVQSVNRTDELNLVAPDVVRASPADFFGSPRPPLLKDFFDPRLRKLLMVRPMKTMIEVEFKMRSYTIAEQLVG